MSRPRKIRPPLTKRAIDAAKPRAKDHFLWDGQEHGLGVKITPAGSKTFILQKSVHGKLKRITLGAYGDLSLEQARREARRLNGEIAKGRDPVADARAERDAEDRRKRAEKTVDELWQRYAVEVIAGNSPRTAAEKLRMWNSRIAPQIAKLKVKNVTENDVSAVVRGATRLDEQGRIIGGQAAAGNLYRLLHHLFSKALNWGMRPRELGNPLENVKEPKVQRRTRLLTSSEVGALIRTIDAAEAEKSEDPMVLAAIKTAILTGARISEVLSLQWDEVRWEDCELHLKTTKTGFSRRPISSEALAVIRGIERMPGSPYVFRSPRRPLQPIYYSTVRKAFDRITARAGVANCTLHTIRHWFGTVTANSVSNHRVGMRLTGHKSHSAYMTYVHEGKEEAKALAKHIGAFTRSLTDGENVVPLRKRS